MICILIPVAYLNFFLGPQACKISSPRRGKNQVWRAAYEFLTVVRKHTRTHTIYVCLAN